MYPRTCAALFAAWLLFYSLPGNSQAAGPGAAHASLRHLRILSGAFSGEVKFGRSGDLALTSLEVRAPWMAEPRRLSGISLADLVGSLGIGEGDLMVYCKGGTIISMPLAEALAKGAFIALQPRNVGGSYALVFPHDQSPGSTVAASMSVREFERLEIR